MRTIDIREVEANLEELMDGLKPGERFVISVNGKPKVQVVALTEEDIEKLREDKG